jgi:hypothetical protein
MVGWVARTRPLAGPLSPRGPQPTVPHTSERNWKPQWPDGSTKRGTAVVVLKRYVQPCGCVLFITIKIDRLDCDASKFSEAPCSSDD